MSLIGGKILRVEIPLVAVTWPELKCISTRRTHSVDLEWVNICAYNFFVSGPKFTQFLLNAVGIAVNSDFRYLDWFMRYSQSKSKVVRNRAKFWTFFPFKFLRYGSPKKLYPSHHAHLMARHVEKFRGVTPSTQKLYARICYILSQFYCDVIPRNFDGLAMSGLVFLVATLKLLTNLLTEVNNSSLSK